jgi:hypothetical protein
MRHQKMISLCSKTLELAEKKKNFSEWVRAQLLKEDETTTTAFRWHYECVGCGTTWVSKVKDEYFYCRYMFKGNCDNHERLEAKVEDVNL